MESMTAPDHGSIFNALAPMQDRAHWTNRCFHLLPNKPLRKQRDASSVSRKKPN
eukprot:gene24626-10586_t